MTETTEGSGVHPNHLPDLRYALDALRLARRAIEPLTQAQIKLHQIKSDTDERIEAAIVGLRYIIKRTEEALSAPVPAVEAPSGWKLVPIEPTEEMAYRGGEATAGRIEWDDAPDDAPDQLARAIYRAMLRAALPLPHEQKQGRDTDGVKTCDGGRHG